MSALGSLELQCSTQATHTHTHIYVTPDGPSVSETLLLSIMEAGVAVDTGPHTLTVISSPFQLFPLEYIYVEHHS